jgi:hypothetical protein
VHLFVREAEGDLRVEVDDDRLNSVRRHVELRTRNSGPPKIGRSLILKKRLKIVDLKSELTR